MTERESARTEVWEWIKSNRGAFGPNGFTSQEIRGSEHPGILDALWALVTANILRPNAPSQRQFELTAFGAEAFNDDSPYDQSEFLRQVRIDAPCLDSDAEGYLALALNIIFTAPQAAVALLRAGLELEIGSLIAVYIAAGHQSSGRLRGQDLSGRISGIVSRLQSEMDSEDVSELNSCCTIVRLGGNRVLHPSGRMPGIDRTEVTTVFHAFRRLSALSSRAMKNKNAPLETY